MAGVARRWGEVGVPLAAYRGKARPVPTPEPFGGDVPDATLRFVVQRHDARRLHYDFRLERDGVLASWAVPKGMPLAAGERHLAVHVEDHPLGLRRLRGRDPGRAVRGRHGRDLGQRHLRARRGEADGGSRCGWTGSGLAGLWTLVPAGLDGDPRNWLLLRKGRRQRPSRVCAHARHLDGRPAERRRAGPSSQNGTATAPWSPSHGRRGHPSERATTTSRPAFRVARALGLAVRSPTACSTARSARSTSRAGRASRPCSRAAGDADRLLRLRRARGRRRAARRPAPTASGGARSSASRPPVAGARSRSLRRRRRPATAAEQQGLEGVVAKRADSRYQPGKRTPDWRKLKTHGAARSSSSRATRTGKGRRTGRFGALVLAVHGADGAALRRQRRHGLHRRGDRAVARAAAPAGAGAALRDRAGDAAGRREDVTWVEPKLVAEVEFAEWTHDGRLRAPSYPGPARRQGAGGGAARARLCRTRSGRRASLRALEPRQALLAGRGDHEGRPARVLP